MTDTLIQTPEVTALAESLLAIGRKRAEIFDGQGEYAGLQSYKEKDDAWIGALKKAIDATSVSGGLTLGAGQAEITPEYQETLMAALDLIDARNAAKKKESDKTRLHEDLIRGIMYNKGTPTDTALRYGMFKRECVRQPLTGFGAFRLFYTVDKPRGVLSKTFGYFSLSTLSQVDRIQVLTMTRHDGMQGLLGGLIDLINPEKPLNEDLSKFIRKTDESLGQAIMKLAGMEITFAGDLEGKTIDGAAAGISKKLQQQDRIASETLKAVSLPLQLLVAEFIKKRMLTSMASAKTSGGRYDDVMVHKFMGTLGRLNTALEKSRTELYEKAAQGEIIEELGNILSILEGSVENDARGGVLTGEATYRAELFLQLREFIQQLVDYQNKKADIDQRRGQGITGWFDAVRQMRALKSPYGHPVGKLPIDSVYDNDYAYTIAFFDFDKVTKAFIGHVSFENAVRPNGAFVRFIKPLGGFQEMEGTKFSMVDKAGRECERLIQLIASSEGEELADLREIIAKSEVKGLRARKAGDVIAQQGDTRGKTLQVQTGYGPNNFRYQHEWAAVLYAGLKLIRETESVFSVETRFRRLCKEIQQRIIDSATRPEDVYLFQPLTAIRMMRGGKLMDEDGVSEQEQAMIIAREWDLKGDTFIMAQKDAYKVLHRNGFDISYDGASQDRRFRSVGFAFGQNPQVPRVVELTRG